ncbi:MAG: hypothetical protein AAF242_17430, partial [Bacteroidota bacterium]
MEVTEFLTHRGTQVNPANCYFGLIGFAVAVCGVYWLKPPAELGAIICVICTLLPIAYLDMRQIAKKPILRKASCGRVGVKMLGLTAILAIVVLAYACLPIRNHLLYEVFYLYH